MPHVAIKMFPGRTIEQKKELAERITKDVMEVCGSERKVVSVSIEEIIPEQWKEKVFIPEIKEKEELIFVPPEYDME